MEDKNIFITIIIILLLLIVFDGGFGMMGWGSYGM